MPAVRSTHQRRGSVDRAWRMHIATLFPSRIETNIFKFHFKKWVICVEAFQNFPL
jgi:hypothetical protein